MRTRILLISGLVLVATALMPAPAAWAQSKALPSRQNNQGMVTVKVTPEVLTDGEWRFAVQLSTHVAPLNEDIAAVSVLSDGQGREEKPVAWQGDPPGGHHRKGVLLFKPMIPRPASITIKIRQIGSVPERVFTWKITE